MSKLAAEHSKEKDEDDLVDFVESTSLLTLAESHKYSSLSSDQKIPIMKSRRYLEHLLRILDDTSAYLNVVNRKFLFLLVETLEDPNTTADLLSQLAKGSKEYLNRSTRDQLLAIICKWKDLILRESEAEANPLFLRCGSITMPFLNLLRHCGMTATLQCSASAFVIRGPQTNDEFESMMSDFYPAWRSCGVNITYMNSESMKDESVRFGDAYCQLFTSDHLPIRLADFSSCGRGTIGAVLSLGLERGGGTSYLLTAAHVAYGNLSPSYGADDTENEKVRIFNDKMHCAHYSRSNSSHIDYSFLPLRVECELRCINAGLATDVFVVDNLTNTQFARADWLLEVWAELIADSAAFVDCKVYKRGIVTGETCGLFKGLTLLQTIEVEVPHNAPAWSKGGDSGALVFMEFDNCLYPIGIHFQGSAGRIGNAIPLWIIFADLCAKNLESGSKLYVRFCSPILSGDCTFDPTRFPSEEELVCPS
jgi:hypothetical protein